jgi:hypothetical protein
MQFSYRLLKNQPKFPLEDICKAGEDHYYWSVKTNFVVKQMALVVSRKQRLGSTVVPRPRPTTVKLFRYFSMAQLIE